MPGHSAATWPRCLHTRHFMPPLRFALASSRRFARASQGRRAHAARRTWRRARELAVQARVGAADCIAGGCKGCIRAAEQRFCNRFQQRAVWTTQWCCTRARGGRGLRDAELHRLTNERLGCQQVDALGTGSKSRGGIHPKQNWYWSRRRHTSNRTRGTRSRHTAASTERLRVCSGTDAAATR